MGLDLDHVEPVAPVGHTGSRRMRHRSDMKKIGAVQGAAGTYIQGLLGGFVQRWSRPGLVIVGLIEHHAMPAGRTRPSAFLTDIVTGRTYPVSQDLGPGSTACQLDATGIVAACEDLRRQIRLGCDLAVISKFGKLEAERGGLTSAFMAAVEADIPILTAVSPVFAREWSAFAGPLAEFLPAEARALDDWWRAATSPARLIAL